MNLCLELLVCFRWISFLFRSMTVLPLVSFVLRGICYIRRIVSEDVLDEVISSFVRVCGTEATLYRAETLNSVWLL